MEHQRIWIEGLNRGDVSAADAVFAPHCVVHITGVAEPLRGVGPWKELLAGLLRAFPDIPNSLNPNSFYRAIARRFPWMLLHLARTSAGGVWPVSDSYCFSDTAH